MKAKSNTDRRGRPFRDNHPFNRFVPQEQMAEIRYGVSIAGADHYYGGLICREGTGKPDPDGLAVTNAMSTAFLSGYLNNDGAARTLLQHADLPKLSNERGFLESTV